MSYINLFINSINPNIYIFRYGKNLYFKTKKRKDPTLITIDSLDELKEIITFPVKIQFEAVSRAQMGRIVKTLLENDVKVIRKTFSKKTKQNYKILCHDVFLTKEKYLKYNFDYVEKNIIIPKQKIKRI